MRPDDDRGQNVHYATSDIYIQNPGVTYVAVVLFVVVVVNLHDRTLYSMTPIP